MILLVGYKLLKMLRGHILDNIYTAFSTTQKKVCKGKVYKYISGMFIGRTGNVIYKQELRPMKKKSCKGCEQCDWISDALSEDLLSDKFPIIDDLKIGELYKLVVVNAFADWETGYIEDFDFAFVKI